MIFRVQWGQKSPKNVFDHNLPWRNRVTISQPFQMETGIFPPQLSPEERNCFRIIGEYIFSIIVVVNIILVLTSQPDPQVLPSIRK